jgi:hypothetical protein
MPTMRDDWFDKLMTTFNRIVAEHCVFREIFAVIGGDLSDQIAQAALPFPLPVIFRARLAAGLFGLVVFPDLRLRAIDIGEAILLGHLAG